MILRKYLLALGVGNKAVPALTAGDRRGKFEELDLVGQWSEAQNFDFGTKFETSVNPRDSVHLAAARNAPAMRSIMEQGNVLVLSTFVIDVQVLLGGLVEISTRNGEPGQVPTRTIGDPFTGTDPIAKGDSSPPEPPKAELNEPSSEKSNIPSERSSDTVRLHLSHLPKSNSFTSDGALLSPASTSTASSQPSHNTTNGTAAEAPLRVLVVDDDPLTRKLMSRMLTRLGCKVTTADNGGVALELILGVQHATPSSEDKGSAGLTLDVSASTSADDYPFAVVFLDNQMPVLSGLEAVAKLRELGRRDFVVGVTGKFSSPRLYQISLKTVALTIASQVTRCLRIKRNI